MDIAQLEVFLAVAREGGFSRAADKLYRTQSAVSQAIRKLESEIGEALFDRSSRDGQLTDAGHVLQEYAERLLNLRESAREALVELRELQKGKLVVGANECSALYVLRVLAEVRRLHPGIQEIQNPSAHGSRTAHAASPQAIRRSGQWRGIPSRNQRRGRNRPRRTGAHSSPGTTCASQAAPDLSQELGAVPCWTRLPENCPIGRAHLRRQILFSAGKSSHCEIGRASCRERV